MSHNAKGYKVPDDYQQAIAEAGTIYGAAKELGVTWQTVQGVMKDHEIVNPKTGRVPGKDEQDQTNN